MRRRPGLSLLAGLFMLTIVGAVSVVEAQAPAARAYNPSRRVPPFFGQVGLTPSQREQIYSIRGKYYEQIAALKQQIEELEAKEDTDCAGVLTDSQRQLLDTLRTARRGGTSTAPAAPAATPTAARAAGNG